MKKKILTILLVVLGLCTSIGLGFVVTNKLQPSTDNKFVPIFEGAKLVESKTTHELKRTQLRDDDDDYESIIPDVIVDSSVTYYATPGSEVRVEVRLKNPSQYEILSLTVNDTKYQSYQFEDGSNSEVLYIDIVVPSVSGEYSYLIDNIKYIDGDDIEDVNMSNGNKTINFGVTYDELPTLSVTNKKINKNSYSATIQAKDLDNVISSGNGLNVYLFSSEKTLLLTKKLDGESLLLDNLNEGNKYTLVIATGLDLLDGKGGKNHILYKESFVTLSSAYISDLSVTDTTVTYSVLKDSDNIIINSLTLVDLLNNKSLDVTTLTTINDLLSSHSYKLVLNYSINDKVIENYVEFKTVDNGLPIIEGLNITSDKTGFTYEYTTSDLNNVIVKEEITVVKDGVTVYTGLTDNLSVNSLLSNTLYTVTLKVSYDLRDGNGVNSVEMSKDITTLTKELPTIGVDYKISGSTFSGVLNIVDNDKVFNLVNIELLDKNDLLIKEINDLSNISDLKLNTNYKLKINYTINLNDNSPLKNESKIIEFTTGKAKPSINMMVYDTTDISFNVDIKETDINNIGEVKAIRLYNNDNVFIKEIPVTNTFSFNDLTANTTYIVKVLYSYDLGDGSGVCEDLYETKITTLSPKPSLDYLNLEATKDSITYDYNVIDKSSVLVSTKVVLYKDNTMVSDVTNLNTFNNLLSNTLYEVRVEVTYDLKDGKGVQSITFNKTISTLSKSKPTVGVDFKVSEDKFMGELNVVDTDNIFKLVNIELLDLNGSLIRELTDISNISGLSLNTKYQIRINYTYDLNDSTGSKTDNTIINFTAGKQKPSLVINVYDVTDNLFRVKLSEVDANNIGEVKKILLYDSNNSLVSDLAVSNSLTFENLNPETIYTLKILYSYDLGDGYGVKEETNSVKITTLKAKPKIQKFNISSTNNSISYSFVTEDINNSIISKTVGLYKDGSLVLDKDINGTYNNLLSNNEYELRILITYDLKDGKGVQTLKLNRTIRTIGKKIPTVNITSEIKENVFNGSINVFDTDNVYELINIELLDRNMQTIRLLDDITLIDNLKTDTQYNIRVNYKFDLNDGNGYKESSYVYKFNTTKKTPTIKFNAYYTSQTLIYLDLRLDNPSNVNAYVESVRLYNDLDVFIKEVHSSYNSYTLDNLTKNAIYKVKVTYRYDLENGMGMQTKEVIHTVRTAKDMPYGHVELTATNDTISSKLNITDTDNTGSVTSVNLYLGDTLVSTGLDYNFSNLLANNIYKVQVVYTYDLNDFNGPKELLIEQSINTIPYNVTLDTTNLRTGSNSITLDYNVVDETNTLNITKVEVFDKANTLTFSTTTINSLNNILLSNLKSSTYYKVVTTYTYDALDGKGTLTYTHNTEYHTGTGKKLIVSNIEILNKDTMTPGEYLDSRVYINNVDNLDITALYVDGIRIPTKLSADSSAVIQYKPNCKGGMYHLTITAYEYAIHAESKVFNIVEALDIVSEQSVLVLGALEGISIDPKTNKEYVNAYNHDFTLNYDGTTGYEIFSIETNWGTIDKSMLTVIAPGQVSFRLPTTHHYDYRSLPNIVVNKIVYGVGAEQRAWNGNYFGEFGTYYDTTTESDTDFVVHIKTAEEFVNISTLNNQDTLKIYVLDNDIDFSGVKYTPVKLNGSFIGNGYKLTNISYSKQTGFTNYKNIGVFSSVYGYVSNLTIENTYISAIVNENDTNSLSLYTGLFAGYIGNSYIKNISIINSTLVSHNTNNYNYSGMFAGYSSSSQIKGINVNGKIDYKMSSYSYGAYLIGDINKANISDIILDVSLINNTHEILKITSGYIKNFISNVIIFINDDVYLNDYSIYNNIISIGNYDISYEYYNNQKNATNCYTNKENPKQPFEFVGTDTLKTKEFYTNLGFDETMWDFTNITNLKPTFKFMTKK